MKKIATLILFAIAFLPVIASKLYLNRNFTDNFRMRRQVDENNDPEETDEEIRASIPECQPYHPEIPDYFKPGRRVSQVKCLEIIWDMHYRKELAERESKCYFEYLARRGLFGGRGAVGGRKAWTGEFPHMGAVGWKASHGTWIFKCGSSLISAKFVLTAGHCIRVSSRDTSVSDPVPKIVRLGDTNILESNDKGTDHDVVDAVISRIIPHPDYESPKKYNDIALMEFVDPVKFTWLIHPACLWGASNINGLGSRGTVTGWGIVDLVKWKTSPDLQVVVLDFINQGQCDSLLRPFCNEKWCGLQTHQMCAGRLEGGVDACQGDSGGPLQVRIKLPNSTREALHYVVGVTSLGIGCAEVNTPGVYTRVASYIDWIEQTVWGRHGESRG